MNGKTVEPPRKTLTLKAKPAAAAAFVVDGSTAPRKRAGGRAKQASQREREKTPQPIQKQSQTQIKKREPQQAPPQLPPQASQQQIPQPPPYTMQRYIAFAPCPQGLEDALARELQTLGFADAKPARAGCQFTADWRGVLRANLYTRLATRILVRLAQAPVAHEEALFALAYDTPWEQWFGPRERLRVDTSAIRSPMRSLHFCNLRVKDAICDRLRDREGARPDIDTARPDARVHVFLDETRATLYLDTTGESLFKRGWRLDKGEAPLRENLASGLLALAGWQPQQALIDPFCGSGTIVIEAACMALGIPAGGARPFGFERLRSHNAAQWRDVKEQARAQQYTHATAPLLGSDTDANLIAAARANAQRAGLPEGVIEWRVGDALNLKPDLEFGLVPGMDTNITPGWVMTNPPYGERMDAAAASFWHDWSGVLKHHYAGWQVGVISNDVAFPKALRLKPKRRIPVHNGALDCRLFVFDMMQSSYRRV